MTPPAPRPDHIELAPPAKLNLYLDVLFKRPDGYHELETVMQTVSLTDRLLVARAPDLPATRIELLVSGRQCPVEGNLVTKAAELWFAASGSRFGLRVVLEKRIPLGAGLGGGSSDAAAMLVALDRLAERPLDPQRLLRVASEIGSDVPFFLTGGTAIVRGRGERVSPLTGVRRFEFVVWYPGVPVVTARVYANLNIDLTRVRTDLPNFVRALSSVRVGGRVGFHNSLESSFRNLHPELAQLQDQISARAGREFRVTGSGSAMFTVVENREQGSEVMRALQAVAAGESFWCESLSG